MPPPRRPWWALSVRSLAWQIPGTVSGARAHCWEPGMDSDRSRFLPAGRGAQIPSVLEQSRLSRSSGWR